MSSSNFASQGTPCGADDRKVLVMVKIHSRTDADPFYSRENIAELERRISDVRAGKSVLKPHEPIETENS